MGETLLDVLGPRRTTCCNSLVRDSADGATPCNSAKHASSSGKLSCVSAVVEGEARKEAAGGRRSNELGTCWCAADSRKAMLPSGRSLAAVASVDRVAAPAV